VLEGLSTDIGRSAVASEKPGLSSVESVSLAMSLVSHTITGSMIRLIEYAQ